MATGGAPPIGAVPARARRRHVWARDLNEARDHDRSECGGAAIELTSRSFTDVFVATVNLNKAYSVHSRCGDCVFCGDVWIGSGIGIHKHD